MTSFHSHSCKNVFFPVILCSDGYYIYIFLKWTHRHTPLRYQHKFVSSVTAIRYYDLSLSDRLPFPLTTHSPPPLRARQRVYENTVPYPRKSVHPSGDVQVLRSQPGNHRRSQHRHFGEVLHNCVGGFILGVLVSRQDAVGGLLWCP